ETAKDDWALTPRQLATVQATRKPVVLQMLANLDEALAELGIQTSAARPLREPVPRELLVVYFETPSGWTALSQAAGVVIAHGLGEVDPGAAATVLGSRLLSPLRERLEGAALVSIIASGRLRSLDF